MQRRWWLIAGILGLAVLTFLLWPRPYCKPARDAYGIIVPICPDGRLHQELQIRGSRLRRGAKGSVTIYARALYTVSTSDTYRSAFIPEVSAKLSLVDAQGKETKLKAEPSVLKPRKPWRHGSIGEITTDVTLPTKLDDGNYKLRARVKTKVAEGVVDLPLPLYAPARIHVLTDRPLYEAGHRIQFRALAVRARDLSPLDHRPGTWVVKDPAGTTVLEERAPAGPWGVVSGDFLLDAEAKTGRWTITWRSGATEGHTSVKVEPFTLPRFRVSATPGKTFYQRNQIPHVAGAVIYSSGAPVQGAKVNLTWSAQGAWPPPSDWLKKTLPRHATTDATGHFALTLPKIPADLQGQVTLNARIAAIDPAGDRVAGSVNVLLSQDAIRVSAFTPLSRGGLVRGANNRLYLRVTTADGRPLSGAKIVVRKAWRQKGEGITTDLDENSVGRVQLDPGAPVNIVIPARPVRASQSSDHSVNRTRAYDLVARQNARLADLVEMDRWLALVRPCAKWVSSGDRAAKVALAFNRAGAFVSSAATTPLARCVVARLHGRRLPKGQDRLYAMTFAFATPRNLPRLTYRATRALDDDDALEDGLSSLFDLATRDARDCLPKHRSGHLPRVLSWRLHAKAKKPSLTWLTGPNTRSRSVPASAERCIMNRLKKRSLPEPATKDAFGLVHFTLSRAPGPRHRRRSRPTIMRGYELLVSASRGKERLGHTKLRMRPGKVQRLLLRADPVLAKAGETITLRLLRGPRFRGSLPRWFKVTHLGETKTIKLPKKAKAGTYRYALPAQAKGWYTFSTQGRRALVFVKSTQNLTVAVKPEKPRYAPGSLARLRVTTRVGDRGAPAAVGLFGVDESLAQLAPLPGPDALRSLQTKVPMKRNVKAFGILDAQALVLGRIRGAYAAEATILRVGHVPKPEAIDVAINASAKTPFDPITVLTDHFYIVLAELHRQARAWEKSAPKGKLMTPKLMASLWKKALSACEGRGKKVVDAFGRRLRLHRLPKDLLALTDPRQVVTTGTRLPEDVENWSLWVHGRKP